MPGMPITFSKPRRSAIATAAAAALAAGGVAYAAIPDSTTGVITSCRDASGGLRVIDKQSGATCPAGTTQLEWNQRGLQGPTGMRGPQGPAGPSNLHWVKVNASGSMTGASDTGVAMYTGAAYAYFAIPNVDPAKCAIMVQPANAMFSDGPITTSYQIYGAYVYARAQQLHPNGSVDWYPKTGMDVVLSCGQVAP